MLDCLVPLPEQQRNCPPLSPVPPRLWVHAAFLVSAVLASASRDPCSSVHLDRSPPLCQGCC
eukprot:1031516-Amphidinium_carterae.1